ncbi:MAG: hypothetical protein ACLUUO_10485 [Sellimonas intestinalis]
MCKNDICQEHLWQFWYYARMRTWGRDPGAGLQRKTGKDDTLLDEVLAIGEILENRGLIDVR